MRLLADENVRKEVIDFLKEAKYDVASVPRGLENSKIARLAKEEKRILLTHDHHFADIFLYPPGDFSGIIRIKIHPPSVPTIIKALKDLFQKVSSEEIDKKLIMLEEDGFRIRE